MGGLVVLLVLHAALSVTGFVLLWRRLDRQRAEIARLKHALSAREKPARKLRTADGAVVSITDLAPQRSAPPLRTASADKPPKTWVQRARAPSARPAYVLALMAITPVLGFFIGGVAAPLGLVSAAAMMVIALRPAWRLAAWVSAASGAVWAIIGLATAPNPLLFSAGAAAAGVIGLTYAHMRSPAAGIALALAMSAATLALGSQAGMISAAGAGFAVIVVAGAIVGALSLRLEAMHLAALGAAVIGLFVLSGQADAAIWFTPATTWTGALFFAIAAVRVPQLGARGVALAGAGAFAPLGAIAALYAARHGLTEPLAAAGAFAALSLALTGLIALSASRRESRLDSLRLSLWMLALGAFTSFASAIVIAAPAPIASLAFSASALGLAVLNACIGMRVWRAFAAVAALLAGVFAMSSARAVLAETVDWPAWLSAGVGIALPALVCGGASILLHRCNGARSAAFVEIAAIILAIAAANIFTRLAFAGGATLLQHMSFVEASVHCSLWLGASLALAAQTHGGAAAARQAASRGLAVAALAGLLSSGIVWLASFWPPAPASAWFSRDSLAFLIPSALLWTHWSFWRMRKTEKRARVAFAAAAASLALFMIVEVVGFENLPLWMKGLGVALIAALAAGVNFLPIVTANGERLRLREKSPSQSALQATR